MTDETTPSEQPLAFTVDDILKFDFETLLATSRPTLNGDESKHTYRDYESLFVDASKEAAASGDTVIQEMCNLFALLCSYQLSLDHNEPFRPKWVIDGRRSYLPEELTPAVIELLLDIVEDIADAELQARVADVLWYLRKGNYQTAQLAVDAYIASAIRLEDPNHWTKSAERIQRALQLAGQLGKKNPKFKMVIGHIENLLDELNGEDPLWFSHRLMSLLISVGEGDPNIYIPLATKLAERAETDHDWRRARGYWELVEKWHIRQQDEGAQYKAQLKAAETYIHHAEDYINQEKPAYRNASHELKYALEALRRIRAPEEQIKEIHLRLRRYQEADDDFKTTSFSMDITEYVHAAIKAIEGQTVRQVILILADSIVPQSVGRVREEAIKLQKQSPLFTWIQAQQIAADGRITAIRPSIDPENVDNDEELLRSEMYRHAIFYQETIAQAIIIPSLRQISLEHRISYRDLQEFVHNNPFIPPQHEEIFIRGFYYGFLGDFTIANNLLIPQIENSIRYMLNRRGIVTTKLDSQGIQDVMKLGQLLHDIPELEQIFGEDLLFEFQGLLISRFGSNLRNQMAHGMMPTMEFSSLRAIYLWGLVLRICCYPALMSEEAELSEDDESPNADET